MTTRAIFQRSDVTKDTLLSLGVAAHLAFPDGSVSPGTLRAEAARGKLAIFRIGKKYYTNLREIEQMVSKSCLVPRKARISISGGDPAANQSGPLETEGMRSARAQLQASMEKLKKGSRNISPQNTDRPSATVIRPEFPSPTSLLSTSKNTRQ
jgi:hypothetical protein